MAFNGSGSWTLPAGQPVVTGTTISSTTHNTLVTDIQTSFGTVICKDGQTTVTANLPMATFRHTGVGAGVATTDYARYDQVQNSAPQVLASVAGTNTVTGSVTPTPAAYVAGQVFRFVPAVTNTGATTLNVSSLGAGAIQSAGAGLVGGELVAGIPVEVFVSTTTPIFHINGGSALQPLVDTGLCEGRLTLTTGVPVTTGDVTAAETVYFTPFRGNRIALYTGTMWKLYTFSEISGDVPDATQMNDVFVYDNAGTLTLDIVAWTNDTTRATALATQDGVLVKTGALPRRYVGSFYSTTAGNGQTEDSLAKRYVWNYYNRQERPMRVLEGTDSWAYTTATIRQANGSAANQLDMVIGVLEDQVEANLSVAVSNTSSGVNAFVGIGLDSTTAFASGFITPYAQTLVAAALQQLHGSWRGFPGIGKHVLTWLEYSGAGVGTTTWYGDTGAPTLNQSGISGSIRG
jgi:hypothetical protein